MPWNPFSSTRIISLSYRQEAVSEHRGQNAWAWEIAGRYPVGDLNMADMAQGALFILACALLYGLAVFLFRDQIKSGR